MDIEEYLSYLLSQTPTTKILKPNIYARITFYEPGIFEKLKNELYLADVSRRFVFLMGYDGLQTLIGKNGFEILTLAGKTREMITDYVKQKGDFKMYIFEDKKLDSVFPASWDGISKLTEKLYPELCGKIAQHIPKLKSTPFNTFQKELGFEFYEALPKTDPRFMTIEKFLASPMTTAHLRLFFYCSLRLLDLFSGDGITYDEKGNPGVKEFVSENTKISNIPRLVMADIDVKIPSN